MQKRNKIIMATVAILLSLVLITTSMVSTTLARYASLKSVGAGFYLETFGIQCGIIFSDAFKTRIGKTIPVVFRDSNSLVVEVENLTLRPGDDFSDAIRFYFANTATVPVNLKIGVEVIPSTAEGEDFIVPAGVANIPADKMLIPYNFVVGVFDGNKTAGLNGTKYSDIADIHTSYLATDIANYNSKIQTNLVNKFYGMGAEGAFVYKRFEAGDDIMLGSESPSKVSDGFYMGFSWPMSGTYPGANNIQIGNPTVYSTADAYDEICTWLTQNKNPTLTVRYIVMIEQADS